MRYPPRWLLRLHWPLRTFAHNGFLASLILLLLSALLLPLIVCVFAWCVARTSEPAPPPVEIAFACVYLSGWILLFGCWVVWQRFPGLASQLSASLSPWPGYRYRRSHWSRLRRDRWKRLISGSWRSVVITDGLARRWSVWFRVPNATRGQRCPRDSSNAYGSVRCCQCRGRRDRRRYGGGRGSVVARTRSEDDDPPKGHDSSPHIHEIYPPGPSVFRSEDWLDCGRTWLDGEMPEVVDEAKSAALLVPSALQTLFYPPRELPVHDFLTSSALSPRVSLAPFVVLPSLHFTAAKPTLFDPEDPKLVEALVELLNKPIPSGLKTMRAGIGQAWLDARAVEVSPELRLPLWSLPLMEEIQLVMNQQRAWQAACDGLRRWSASSNPELSALAGECMIALKTLPRNSALPAFQAGTVHLRGLLGEAWLSDDHINCGLEYLRSFITNGDALLGTHMLDSLDAQVSGTATYAARVTLPALEQRIIAHGTKRLWFPLHVHGNHWTLLAIDIERRAYIFGNSLSRRSSPPADALSRLTRWLCTIGVWPMNVEPTTRSLRLMPQQPDGFSCGVVVLSTIAHVLLGLPAWSAPSAEAHRLMWFLRLSASDPWRSDELSLASQRPTVDLISLSDDTVGAPRSEPLRSRVIDTGREGASNDLSVTALFNGLESDTSMEESETSQSLSSEASCMVSDADSSGWAPDSHRSGTVRTRDDTDSEEDADVDRTPRKRHPKRFRPATAERRSGAKGWEYQRSRRDGERPTTNSPALLQFQEKINAIDPDAEFDDDNFRRVRCSRCSNWVVMRLAYEVRRFEEHRETRRCLDRADGAAGQTHTLFFFGFEKGTATVSSTVKPHRPLKRRAPSPDKIQRDCPGLTSAVEPKIEDYLSRTAVAGGGAPSLDRLVQALYPGSTWTSLGDRERKAVHRREAAEYRWLNNHHLLAVYARDCLGKVLAIPSPDCPPCSKCNALLSDRGFRTRLNHRMPAEANFRFVPERFRATALMDLYLKYAGLKGLMEGKDGTTAWYRFARGVADGEYTQYPVFLGMVQAFITKAGRERRGKGMQNMVYPACFNELCNALALLSPRTYRLFRKELGGRSIRSFQGLRSRMGRFVPGISLQNIHAVSTVYAKLGYNGPVALSFDDTVLTPALTAYQEKDGRYRIVGGVGEPPVVTEEETDERIVAMLKEGRAHLATKVRVYVLSIPLPGLPPTVIASVARAGRETAEDLWVMHDRLMGILHESGLHPVSIAADGTETERKLQRLIKARAPRIRPYRINTTSGHFVTLEVPLIHGLPSVIVQDSKHAAKTGRNQIFSGSKLMTLGDHPVFYELLYLICQRPDCPLFWRDIDNVDRQDDRAVRRLLSADFLKYLLNAGDPAHRGLIVYLFVLGEVLDAWQNRTLKPAERALLALRTLFFLRGWQAHTKLHDAHTFSHNFISREFTEILTILCESLLALILVYRDYYPEHPFLPWLHSTEVCEHIFGILRQLQKDFNYGDFLFMIPKLQVLLLGDYQKFATQADDSDTAAGPFHTYFDHEGIQLTALKSWPTDTELDEAGTQAFLEAEKLLEKVGIKLREVLSVETESEDEDAVEEEVEEPLLGSANEPAAETAWDEIADLMAVFETAPLSGPKLDGEITAVALAVAAEKVDDAVQTAKVPDTEEDGTFINKILEILDGVVEAIKDDAARQENAPETMSSLLYEADLLASLLGEDGKLRALHEAKDEVFWQLAVALRTIHQPPSTWKALRRHGRPVRTQDDGVAVPTVRRRLADHLRSLIPGHLRGVTWGIGRQVRTGGDVQLGPAEGGTRAASKNIVRADRARKYLSHRESAFKSFHHLHPQALVANISDVGTEMHLKAGSFILALNKTAVVIAKVITMYSKGPGKYGRYELVRDATSLGRVTALGIQVFSLYAGATFQSVGCETLNARTYLWITVSRLLFSLARFKVTESTVPTESTPLTFVNLSQEAYEMYKSWQCWGSELFVAVKTLDLLVKKGDAAEETEAAI